MVSQLSGRDAGGALLSVWLLVFGLVYLAPAEANGSTPLLLLAVLAGVIALAMGLAYAARRLSRREPLDAVRTIGGPAVVALIVGLLVAAAGLPLEGILGYVVPAGVATWLVASDRLGRMPQSATELTALVAGPERPPDPAPSAARARRPTPAERAVQFTHDAFALDRSRLEVLVAASADVDRGERERAWDQVRPALTAARRKNVFTGVRDQLGRWASGTGEGEEAGRPDVPLLLRRRAVPALLDAAAAVIAQDRLGQRQFEQLYGSFRMASDGTPAQFDAAAAATPRMGAPAEEE